MRARLAKAFDDDLLTSIVMHPELRRWNSHDGAPAFDPALFTGDPAASRGNSFAVIVEDKLGALGCFLAFAIERGAYTIHTNLLPSCRGARASEVSALALEFAFLHTDAVQLWSIVPDCNKQALWFAHSMGFRDTYRLSKTWLSGGALHDVQHVRLDIDDWILGDKQLEESGGARHDQLHAICGFDDHQRQDVHNAYIGAVAELIDAGRVDKACEIYGRWARASGHQAFEILSLDPVRIGMYGVVLRVEGGELIREKEQDFNFPEWTRQMEASRWAA